MVGLVVIASVVLFTVGISLLVRASMRAEARKQLDALTIAGRRLGGKRVGEASFVDGHLAGLPMRFMLTSRGIGSGSEAWTELECQLPSATAANLQLALWPSGRDLEREVAAGHRIDIVVGDRVFDTAYMIEGAPTDIVRAVLDAETRAALLALGRCELRFPRPGPGLPNPTDAPASFAVVQLAMRGWLEDEAGIIAALNALARLAQRLVAAPTEVIEAIPLQTSGTPYRAITSDAARTDARARQAHEVRALEALRKRRAADGTTTGSLGAITALLVVGGIIILAALASMGD